MHKRTRTPLAPTEPAPFTGLVIEQPDLFSLEQLQQLQRPRRPLNFVQLLEHETRARLEACTEHAELGCPRTHAR